MAEEMTLGQMADKAHVLRAKYRKAQSRADELKKEFDDFKEQIMDRIESEKLEGSLVRGKKATVSLKPKTVPTVKDWAKVFKYVKTNDAFHLFERRISSSAWREEVQARKNRDIPGIEKFEKRDLSVTTL